MPTDNDNQESKLALRRHFLRAYHVEKPPRVFDCCQGSAVIWTQLRKEFTLASYWGVDTKKSPGRLTVDSRRIVSQADFAADVVDVDTYGLPWRHYLPLVRNLRAPCTVFLTIGKAGGLQGVLTPEVARAVGATFRTLKVPNAFSLMIGSAAFEALLFGSLPPGWRVIEAAESPPGKNARYVGIRLSPV